jgi:hypothetical protein
MMAVAVSEVRKNGSPSSIHDSRGIGPNVNTNCDGDGADQHGLNW